MQGSADAGVQGLLEGDILGLIVGSLCVDDIVIDDHLFGPLEAHCLLQH